MDASASHWMVVLAKSLYTVHGSNETQNVMATYILVWTDQICSGRVLCCVFWIALFKIYSSEYIIQNIFLQ